MNDELKNFIYEHIELINQNTKESWEQIYEELDYSIISEFTQTILDAGINDPAAIMEYIPKNYLYKSKIKNYRIPDNVTRIGEYAFYNCNILTSVEIGDNVTSIGSGAFEYCRRLTSITIPDSVTSTGSEAFHGCNNLTSVVIGDSVTTIGSYAFSGCKSLTEIVIPDNVTVIEKSAFEDCINLKIVEIPNNITNIGKEAFCYCDLLKELKFKGTMKQAIKCGIGNKSMSKWRRGSSIEKIICNDGVIEL